MSALAVDPDLRGFFAPELDTALDATALAPSGTTRTYLVELLARYANTPFASALREPLVFRLAAAFESADMPRRVASLRAVGDDALVLCGFFDAHLESRGIERRYVAALGGRAYDGAARAGRGLEAVAVAYGELAKDFLGYASVLDEVRERTSMRTPQDIVRLYERYKRAPSPRLAERLRAEGVFPQPGTGSATGGGLLH